ncbi:MAG: TIGR04283 family arsenosugar biosynthesis glycosyltransferase [Gammaproteobacteria bacterium]|nr:TIGR04283 family arsenosugar biosynthesis glycosyltransferase [Gammaproteobacteria bacterium]MCP5137907.1 TIGR04283 family arsenosugar biosynthesis glycosyltransferase [Gammaproteobacteria bacterium]
MNRCSIIVPALNEAGGIVACLTALETMRARGGEVIVVDGGSRDQTRFLAAPLADLVLAASRGRASQMNAGAAAARGDVLCFVHADTVLSAEAIAQLQEVRRWGRFEVRFSGRSGLLRLVAWMMNRRSCLSGIATGDQCMVMTRECFDRVGGFPELPLMEDVEISKRLRRIARPHCFRASVTTDSRRWDSRGTVRTILLMWWLRLAYFLGVSPQRLARWYR